MGEVIVPKVTAPKASPTDDQSAIPDDVAAPVSDGAPVNVGRTSRHQANARESNPAAAPHDDEDEDEVDIDDDEEDDDEEDLVVYTAREAAGAIATILAFIRPLLGNYRRALIAVGLGLLVETLFNVIMPLSLKFLIDDALGEEDFLALLWILSALAVAGVITSVISVWYERWDARLSSSIISDVRLRLFDHVQNLPSAFFARTRRGEILSRFSVDLASFEGAMETLANTALLPAMELVAGIVLMLFLNWQLAVVALLVLPITLIGPRILTPKAVLAGYEQKVSESAILGMVQENIAAQAVIKAFSLQGRARGWFTSRNTETRKKIEASTFLSSMVERSVTIAVLLLHLTVLGIGAYLATKGRITIGTFVTFESAFWEISYNISHLMSYIPVSISVCCGGPAHAGSAGRADPGRRSTGGAGPAAHHQ